MPKHTYDFSLVFTGPGGLSSVWQIEVEARIIPEDPTEPLCTSSAVVEILHIAKYQGMKKQPTDNNLDSLLWNHPDLLRAIYEDWKQSQ